MSAASSLARDEAPRLPGYRVEGVLGRGAAGVVYLVRAEDALGRRFALKLFAAGGGREYQRELATLRAIEAARAEAGSRDLVPTVAVGEAEGAPYVVMDYFEAGDLQARVRRDGPLPAPRAVSLTRAVLRGLTLLHRRGIVHKDVKPANVLVGDDGRARLGDFGLARLADGPVSAAGTPGYCAPEVYAGRDGDLRAGPALDVYSAAATLYFLLSGEAPLPGRPDVFLLERRRVDRALQQVLLEALAVDPRDRPSLAALDAALEAWEAGALPAAPRRREASAGARWALLGAGLGGAGLALLAVAIHQHAQDPGAPRAAAGAPSSAAAPAGVGPAEVATPPPPEGAPHEARATPGPGRGAGAALTWTWDGRDLRADGAPVEWTPAGPRLAGQEEVLVAARLPRRPRAFAASADGAVQAAADDRGRTLAVALDPPALLLEVPGPARGPLGELGAAPLVLLATDGDYLARLVVPTGWEPAPDLLEVWELASGRRVARLELRHDDGLLPSALALLPGRGQGPGAVLLGTVDGRIALHPLRASAPQLIVRTHRDEVRALAVDVEAGRVLVLGDDSALPPGEVDEETGLPLAPRLRIKAYDLGQLLDGSPGPPLGDEPALPALGGPGGER